MPATPYKGVAANAYPRTKQSACYQEHVPSSTSVQGPNNSGHLVVDLVLWAPEGGKIHSTPVGEEFQCWSPPVYAGHCSGQSLIAKPHANEDKNLAE